MKTARVCEMLPGQNKIKLKILPATNELSNPSRARNVAPESYEIILHFRRHEKTTNAYA